MIVECIVEGHGEVAAVPVLLRRLRDQAQAFDVEIGPPIRRKLSELMDKEGIQRAVGIARLRPRCGAILLLFDSEDSCPKDLAPKIRQWAKEAAGTVPCEVVLAYREYETWFLAAIESLRGKKGITPDAMPLPNPESRRDAKGALEEYMPRDSSYDETVDQPSLSAEFDLGLTYRRSRSFRKLIKAFGSLIASQTPLGAPWPPVQWIERS